MKVPSLSETRFSSVARPLRKVIVAMDFHCSSLVLLCSLLLLTACKREVLHDLSEPQANTIVARLHTVEIEAQKTRQADGHWSIVVQEDKFQEALQFLTRARLVQAETSTSDEVEGGLFPRNLRGTLSYQKVLGAEIRETLRSLPGVLDAKVHLYLPKQDSLFERHQSSRGTGSVLLVVSTEAHIVNEEIAQLVGGAAGLQHQDVSVLQTIEVNPGPIPEKHEISEQVEHLGLHPDRPKSAPAWIVADLPSKPFLSVTALLLLVVGSFLIFRSYRDEMYPSVRQDASGD